MRFIFLFLTLFLASCSTATNTATSTDVTVSLASQVATGAIGAPSEIPLNVQSIRITAINASGQIIAGPLVANRPNFFATLRTPNGNQIRFRMVAFDATNAQGTKIYESLSQPFNLTGAPIVVHLTMNLAIAVTSNRNQVFRGDLVNIAGRVAGKLPPATSPLIWTSNGGSLNIIDAYGATGTWQAPNTLGTFTIAAHIDPSINLDQNQNVIGSMNIQVLNRDPYIDTFNATPILAYTGATSTFPLIIVGDLDGDALQAVSPNKPTWATLVPQGSNPLNVGLVLTPPLGTSGSFTFRVAASDGLGGNISKNITITIDNNIPAPVIDVFSPLTYTPAVDIYGYALVGSNVDIYADGIFVAQVQPSSFSEFTLAPNMGDFFYTIPNLANGTHTITAYAKFGTNLSPISNSATITVNAFIGTPLTSTNLITTNPSSVATTDLNNDFYTDVIVGDSAGNVYIYPGDGTSGIVGAVPFQITTGAAGMNQFAIGDINNDTYTDIVLPSATNDTITILTGNATGTPTLQPPIPIDAYAAPNAATIVDLNNDGYADILTANNGSILGLGTGDTVSTLNGSSQGLALGNLTTIPGISGLTSITTADFNLDAYADVAIAGSTLVVATNNPAGAPLMSPYPISGPVHVSTGFLNTDAYADIVTCTSNGSITVLLNGGTLGGFPTTSTYILPFGSIPKWAAIGDMNGDFYDDIVVAVSGNNSIVILLNDGFGSFTPLVYPVSGVDPSSIALGYIDSDFKLDIIIANATSKNISLFLNTSISIPLLGGAQ